MTDETPNPQDSNKEEPNGEDFSPEELSLPSEHLDSDEVFDASSDQVEEAVFLESFKDDLPVLPVPPAPGSEDVPEPPPADFEPLVFVPEVIEPEVLAPAITHSVEMPKIPADSLVQDESRVRIFVRKAIRWTAGFLIMFGLGAIAAIFLFYKPAYNQVVSDQADRASEKQTIVDLQAEVAALKDRNAVIPGLEEQIQTLTEESAQKDVHIQLLSVLADVYAAQAALAVEDISQTGIYLYTTPDKLDAMAQIIGPTESAAVDSLSERLQQVLTSLEAEDVFTAQSDLNVMENRLLQLEKLYFTVP